MDHSDELQLRYYERTAAEYDASHLCEGGAHEVALEEISRLIAHREIRSFLDVGAGTGRSARYLAERHATLKIRGIDRSLSLVRVALERGVVPGQIMLATGQALPFGDRAFDAVAEFGVLHHVRDPVGVVREMTRVAKRAIFLSDSNRFGQGRRIARLLKLMLYKTKLWPFANFLKTGGRGFTISEGDGVSFSYSVYDSVKMLSEWADEIVVIGTSGEDSGERDPLLACGQALLCAFRS